MHYCPYCGANVLENEDYCINCGKQLPQDRHERMKTKQPFNKYWYIPIAVVALILFVSGSYYIFLQNQSAEATDLYQNAETYALNGDYSKATSSLEESLNHRSDFQQAKNALAFTQKAVKINEDLDKASNLQKKGEYRDASALINEAEDSIANYDGEAVTKLIDKLTAKRNHIKLAHLKNKLNQDPGIDKLKVLLWEADAIPSDEADDIKSSIRGQIVDYVFSNASNQLNNHQFSDALLMVEDGLKYAPDSKKLLSLQTTIKKEKTAFETARKQRIEQAISSAEKEKKLNENDAVELISVSTEENKQGNLSVTGKVKSVATVPIHSILIEYSLSSDEETILTNDVYIYPDTLYPDATGEFEFTHYNMEQQKPNDIHINVDRIKWYTDQS
ncbi:hypothetical protein GCM10008983_25160 [Lentibacillus halophilus]|uniref:Zinc-ribbon domain-containing protein n=1 Tax=Lentibacillus halophilus TaxID=295065 RepID=A0ABN0ZG77_9BACI